MKRKPYPKYKPSGVEWLGDVPEHWEVKRGRFAMSVNPPSPQLRALEQDDEVSFVPMEAVGVAGGLNLEQRRFLAEISSGYTEFQDGDVVVAKITPCFDNGKAALACGLLNGAAYGTTELHVLRAGPSTDSSFLFYVAVSDTFRKLGESEMFGAGGQKRVPAEFCKDFRTPLPPLSEQRAIAAFLDRETGRIDALIAKKRELAERLKEKRTALISHTVTHGLPPDAAKKAGLPVNPPLKPSGVEWLGDIPQHWSTPPLYTRYDIKLGKMLNEGRITGHALTPYLRNVDVQWDYINFEDLPEMDIEDKDRSRYTLKTGDLIVCEGGEVGRAAIFDGSKPIIGYQKALHRMRPLCNAEEPRYLFFTLMWASAIGVFLAEGNPNTIPHLTGEKLRRYRFPCPPVAEQAAIAAYLDAATSKLDALISKLEETVERLQEYRTALITAAVTGKIDVRECYQYGNSSC